MVFKKFKPTVDFPGPKLPVVVVVSLLLADVGDEINLSRRRVIILYNSFARDADDLLVYNNIVIISARRTRSRARTSLLRGTPSTVVVAADAAAVYPPPLLPSHTRGDIILDTCRRTTARG